MLRLKFMRIKPAQLFIFGQVAFATLPADIFSVKSRAFLIDYILVIELGTDTLELEMVTGGYV